MELIHLISQNSNYTEEIRTSKMKNMFASRACRMSIMVGNPLNKSTMSKIVKNLSSLQSPWNCPHG